MHLHGLAVSYLEMRLRPDAARKGKAIQFESPDRKFVAGCAAPATAVGIAERGTRARTKCNAASRQASRRLTVPNLAA